MTKAALIQFFLHFFYPVLFQSLPGFAVRNIKYVLEMVPTT